MFARTIFKEVFQVHNNYIKDLFGFEDVTIKKVETDDISVTIHLETIKKEHVCPCCGNTTSKVHDYRFQTIKDAPFQFKNTFINIRKRRYKCKHCGKQFFENLNFLPKYYRITNKLTAAVYNKFLTTNSIKQIASETNLSSNTIYRILSLFNVSNNLLPEVLSIDEFKGNTWGEKYQCILTDPVNKRVLDILPERYKPYLTSYFKQYPKKVRNGVTYFVSDMWRTYADICDVWFKNATQVIDKYHWIRQAIWAFENVRKEEQKKLSPKLKKYFKRSKSLLIKRYDSLEEEQKQQVNVMLYYSVNISRAYFYKEEFLKILSNKDAESAKKAMSEWIQNAENCGIPQFKKCAYTMRNWYTGIINSFSTTITNGFTEGCNNKIKVLKRNAYGYKNFKRFRNRILHIFSHHLLNNKQAAA